MLVDEMLGDSRVTEVMIRWVRRHWRRCLALLLARRSVAGESRVGNQAARPGDRFGLLEFALMGERAKVSWADRDVLGIPSSGWSFSRWLRRRAFLFAFHEQSGTWQ